MTGQVLRELRTIAGIGLRRMADRTHWSAAYLSQIENGTRPVPAAVVAAYREVLGGDPVAGRLEVAIADPSGVGVADVAVILERTRHLEDQIGASAVAPVVRGMDSLARALDNRMGSEVSRYRGWIEHTLGYRATADKVLADATALAQDGPQRAHALSFRSLVARHNGELAKAIDLADAGLAEDGVHPALRTFDRYWRGELLARRGENRAAAKAIAPDSTESDELPPGGYWYTPGFLAVQRGLVLACMGRKADGIEEASQGLAQMPEAHRAADWIGVMLRQIDPEMTAELA